VSKPSRADLLKEGGLYPVIVPLGWKLIGSAGEDVAIPAVPGHACHRFLARGALLATEVERNAHPELMTVRQVRFVGPVTAEVLDRCAAVVVDALANQGVKPRVDDKRVGVCALSSEACGRIAIRRMAFGDRRMEIHYLLRDQKHQPWELSYLVRQANVESWRPLFAEMDGPGMASTAR
jgi:hypothetical protein